MIFDKTDYINRENVEYDKENLCELELLDFLGQYCNIEVTVMETIQSFLKQYHTNTELLLELLDLANPELCEKIMLEYRKLNKARAEQFRRVAVKIAETVLMENPKADVFQDEEFLDEVFLDEDSEPEMDEEGYSQNIEKVLELAEFTDADASFEETKIDETILDPMKNSETAEMDEDISRIPEDIDEVVIENKYESTKRGMLLKEKTEIMKPEKKDSKGVLMFDVDSLFVEKNTKKKKGSNENFDFFYKK